MVGFVIAIGFLLYTVSIVTSGPGSSTSKASSSTFLTPGDDPLSLQQDLKSLGQDPVATDENELTNFH